MIRLAALIAGVVVFVSACGSEESAAVEPTGVSRSLPTVPTPYLPFDMPITGPAKVFAHYMPNFPISIDNKPAASDYYATEYLRPDGEGGIHSAYGGYLRDRPIPVPPSAHDDWQKRNVEREISQAASVGIDGFAVDVILPRGTSDVVDTILSAADEHQPFSIMLTMDMGGPVATDQSMTAFADDIVRYAHSPAAYRLADGRLVLSAFRAELRPVGWWQQVLRILTDRGVHVAFFPILLDTSAHLENFATISYGIGWWGGRSPNAFSLTDRNRGSAIDLVHRSRHLNRKVLVPVAFQDVRPAAGIYFEARNGATMRASWNFARHVDADLVEIMTWNDYSEATAVAPSARHGYRLLDMMAFEIATLKSGAPPAVERDAVFATYRTQRYDARPTFPQTQVMTLREDSVAAVNEVEVTSFARGPATITVRIGTDTRQCHVPIGAAHCTFPWRAGPISVELSRDGRTVARAGGGPSGTMTPQVQDLEYVAIGGLR